ncbi:MAG: carboxylesterase family protein [Desulfovibrio sp.]|jgi:para-nitrobenzyl esterase|nr:carboxylesterase family protein [Desulfovibrio sp.]
MKKIFSVFLSLLLFVICSRAESAQPTVSTSLGKVVGVEKEGLRIFKGIPYAKPPVGELRFAPPQSIGPWTSPLDATEYGPAAIQIRREENLDMSEDCLTLNIWTPAEAGESDRLPVYVYIHGGAYALGTGSDAMYDAASFARQGIVAVTINYRLNAMGFLAGRATFDKYGTTGNWGHLDQIMALEWLRDNVAAFGGDPGKVTVGGESAGSYSVSALILSPLAKGLFHGAIMESGTILGAAATSYYAKCDLARSIELGKMLSSVFHADDNAEGLAGLRQADATVLAQLAQFRWDQTSLAPFPLMPVFDGKVIPENPYKALKDGTFNKVRVLWGFNRDEGSIFVPETTSEPTYAMLAAINCGNDNARAVLARFPVDADHPAFRRVRRLLAYTGFTAGMKTFADAAVAQGLDVYAYNFNYVSPKDAAGGLGARHAAELPYVFNNLHVEGLKEPEQQALADEMHLRWGNFIKTGDPNQGVKLPTNIQWPKYNSQNSDVMRFDTSVTVGTLPDKEDMEFMERLLILPWL